jgi:hypothetical protein
MDDPYPDAPIAERIREAMVELLVERGPGKTICPSEVARHLGDRFGWRWEDLMRPVRTVAATLADQGVLEATQNRRVVDLRDVRGPVRLRLRPLIAVRTRTPIED